MIRITALSFAFGALLFTTACLDKDPESSQPGPLNGQTDAARETSGVEMSQASDTEAPDATASDPGSRCNYTFIFRHGDDATPMEIKVAGNFENEAWSGSLPLERANESGEWAATIELSEGQYEYKFIIDGVWTQDVENPEVSGGDDGNSVLVHRCPFEPQCLLNADCSDNAESPVCRNYACASCGCPNEQFCHPENGQCVDQLPCTGSADCAMGEVCRAGACGECVDSSECAESEVCSEGACIEAQCEDDDACDPYTESCQGRLCGLRPCSVQLFTFDPAGAQYDQVLVAGEFTAGVNGAGELDWSVGAVPMTLRSDGRWSTTIALENGRYLYKFITYPAGSTDPVWVTDSGNPDLEPDPFGGENSVLTMACTAQGNQGLCGDPDTFQWQDAVMYFAMIDRFRDGDGMVDEVPNATGGDARNGPSGQYTGGDLQGLTEKIPYLQDLGVNSLWLSAPYENRNGAGEAIDPGRDPHMYSAYHGYWPSPANIDYSDPDSPSPIPMVEPRIGTAADLHTLVDTAHNSGMTVLFDYVMNHVDLDSGLYQAHPDWFANDFDASGQRLNTFANCGRQNLWDDDYWGTRCAFTDYLPPFEFDNDAARAWSIADAIWWAKEFNIDGYRLDAIKHVSLTWLTDLRVALNAAFPEPEGGRFYLVGETFAYDDIPLLASFIDPPTMLDGQFDFPMKARLCEGVFQGHMDWLQGWMDTENRAPYGSDAIMTTWIGNHDIPRAIHFASGELMNCREGSNPDNGWNWSPPQPADARPYELLGLAFGVLMTNPGIPLIYYGDEIGLAGGGDPDNRRVMPWDDTQLSAAQIALRNQISSLAAIRAQQKALSRGRRVTLSADNDSWAFRMTCQSPVIDDVTVVINRGENEKVIQGVPAGEYTDLVTGLPVTADDPVPARQIRIMVSRD